MDTATISVLVAGTVGIVGVLAPLRGLRSQQGHERAMRAEEHAHERAMRARERDAEVIAKAVDVLMEANQLIADGPRTTSTEDAREHAERLRASAEQLRREQGRMAARFGVNDPLCNSLGEAVRGLHGVANPLSVLGQGVEPVQGWQEENEAYFGRALDAFLGLASNRAKTDRAVTQPSTHPAR